MPNEEEVLEMEQFFQGRGWVPEKFVVTREEVVHLIQVVERYSREHLEGHQEDPTAICLFNAGSERDLVLEDELWGDQVNEDLVALTASALWYFGYDANHGGD